MGAYESFALSKIQGGYPRMGMIVILEGVLNIHLEPAVSERHFVVTGKYSRHAYASESRNFNCRLLQ
jgi:hypothetical protein